MSLKRKSSNISTTSIIDSMEIEALATYFSKSAKETYTLLGITPSSFNKMCRRLGVERWPFRRYRSLATSKADLEKSILHASPDDKKKLEYEIKCLTIQLEEIFKAPKTQKPLIVLPSSSSSSVSSSSSSPSSSYTKVQVLPSLRTVLSCYPTRTSRVDSMYEVNTHKSTNGSIHPTPFHTKRFRSTSFQELSFYSSSSMDPSRIALSLFNKRKRSDSMCLSSILC